MPTRQGITACLTAGPHVVGLFTVHFPHSEEFFTVRNICENLRESARICEDVPEQIFQQSINLYLRGS